MIVKERMKNSGTYDGRIKHVSLYIINPCIDNKNYLVNKEEIISRERTELLPDGQPTGVEKKGYLYDSKERVNKTNKHIAKDNIKRKNRMMVKSSETFPHMPSEWKDYHEINLDDQTHPQFRTYKENHWPKSTRIKTRGYINKYHMMRKYSWTMIRPLEMHYESRVGMDF